MGINWLSRSSKTNKTNESLVDAEESVSVPAGSEIRPTSVPA